jgi:hypothetical protein
VALLRFDVDTETAFIFPGSPLVDSAAQYRFSGTASKSGSLDCTPSRSYTCDAIEPPLDLVNREDEAWKEHRVVEKNEMTSR